eukprot:7549539-Pyramimonas_sp.AAC.1
MKPLTSHFTAEELDSPPFLVTGHACLCRPLTAAETNKEQPRLGTRTVSTGREPFDQEDEDDPAAGVRRSRVVAACAGARPDRGETGDALTISHHGKKGPLTWREKAEAARRARQAADLQSRRVGEKRQSPVDICSISA